VEWVSRLVLVEKVMVETMLWGATVATEKNFCEDKLDKVTIIVK